MERRPAQPGEQKSGDAGDVRAIRDKYIAVLEEQIVVPARQELDAHREKLQQQLKNAERARGEPDYGTVYRGLTNQMQKVERTLDVMDRGLTRIRSMDLHEVEKFVGRG
jgi:hypothetical protein